MDTALTLEAIDSLDHRACTEALRELERADRRSAALRSQLLNRAIASGGYRDDGHQSARTWATAECNWSGPQAHAHLRIARLVAAHPRVGDALMAGTLGLAQAAELAGLHANPRARHLLAGSIDLLLRYAGQQRHRDFQVICRRWLSHADPDGFHRDREHAEAERGGSVATVGAEFHLRLHGSALAGTEMIEILQRFRDAEFRSDWNDVRTVHGDAADASLLARTDQQRLFDAVQTIFRRAAGSGEISVTEPMINIVVDEDTFRHHVDTVFGAPTDPIDPSTAADRRCETDTGVILDPHQLVAAALIGRARLLLVDPTFRVLDVGRSHRLFRGAARTAVRTTTPWCTWPGCPVHARRAQVDHVVDWAGEGRTDTANGGVECSHHNMLKSRGRFTVWRDPGGVWHTYRPDGSEIAPNFDPSVHHSHGPPDRRTVA